MEKLNCSYCGTDQREVLLGNESEPICNRCLHSKGDRLAGNWFFWLKANDPQTWQEIVDNHRLGTDHVASTVRRIRIDP